MNALTITTLDDEPRILDPELAERLGFERPGKIRELIERHMPQLVLFGNCPTVGQRVGTRGPSAKVYYLNEDQATYIASSSETPKALEIKVEIIKVFGACRRGQLVLASTTPAIPTNFAAALQVTV